MVLTLTKIITFHDLYIQLYSYILRHTLRRVHLLADMCVLCSRTVKTIISMSVPYQITRAVPHALLMADCNQQMAWDAANTEMPNTEVLN